MKVGVILPLGEIEHLGRTMSYAEIRGLARQVEEAGFDSVWIYDHLLYRFPDREPFGVWEGWTIMTALAEATERVEIGGLVFCTAFRNPAVLAKMAVTLDEVSGGRIILGLGCGWHEPEFDAFGLPFDHRVDRFEEACEIIVPLVKEGTVDFTGRYYSAPNCEMLPPSREGGIPVLIASSKPRMHGLTATFADSWNTAWLGQASALTPRREGIEAACAEAGRDPATLEITVGVNVAFPEKEGAPEDVSNPERFLTGTADELAAGLQGYADAGVGHVICNCMPVETETISRLGEALARFKAPVGVT
ncbi:MAG: LLM class flavin-dependent oxidoreductase [Thermomicrobiales bacterium]